MKKEKSSNTPQIWWRMRLHLPYAIEPVRVISFTAKTVTVERAGHASREFRKGGYVYYYPTYQEAKAVQREIAYRNVDKAQAVLDAAIAQLEKVKLNDASQEAALLEQFRQLEKMHLDNVHKPIEF
jgi:hypothetical protein